MVRETGAVERHLLDTGGLGPLGDALAHDRRRSGVATLARRAELRAQLLLGGGTAGEHLGAIVGNDAGVDVEVGAVHREARHVLLDDAHARLTGAAQSLVFLVQHGARAPYFFLVSLSTTRSPA